MYNYRNIRRCKHEVLLRFRKHNFSHSSIRTLFHVKECKQMGLTHRDTDFMHVHCTRLPIRLTRFSFTIYWASTVKLNFISKFEISWCCVIFPIDHSILIGKLELTLLDLTWLITVQKETLRMQLVYRLAAWILMHSHCILNRCHFKLLHGLDWTTYSQLLIRDFS